MRFGSSKRNSMGLDMILATYGWVRSSNMTNIASGDSGKKKKLKHMLREAITIALIIACKD